VNLILNGHPHAVNPFQQLEHPAQGGTTCRLMDLIGQRVVCANARCRRRWATDTSSARSSPSAVPECERVFHNNDDENSGSFEKTEPALRPA
jgi:hypothetical protein